MEHVVEMMDQLMKRQQMQQQGFQQRIQQHQLEAQQQQLKMMKHPFTTSKEKGQDLTPLSSYVEGEDIEAIPSYLGENNVSERNACAGVGEMSGTIFSK